MKNRTLPAAAPAHRRAFTLVELLFVCAAMVALLALAAPASLSLLRSSNMNRATSIISDELNLARQLAMAQNREVEVRFYKVGTEASTQDLQFRAFRCFVGGGGDPTQFKSVGGVHYLPGAVVISADPKVSTLFDYGNPNRSGLAFSQETLPGSNAPVDYLSFSFRTNGGTNLAPVDLPEGNWYFTFYLENDSRNPVTGIPDNFCTVQIEPVTGRVRVYRP